MRLGFKTKQENRRPHGGTDDQLREHVNEKNQKPRNHTAQVHWRCRRHGRPRRRVELRADGTWDVDGLKRVILEKRVTDPWPSYQEVLDAEFVSLQPHLGEDRACELRRKILDLENSSTPG